VEYKRTGDGLELQHNSQRNREGRRKDSPVRHSGSSPAAGSKTHQQQAPH